MLLSRSCILKVSREGILAIFVGCSSVLVVCLCSNVIRKGLGFCLVLIHAEVPGTLCRKGEDHNLAINANSAVSDGAAVFLSWLVNCHCHLQSK